MVVVVAVVWDRAVVVASFVCFLVDNGAAIFDDVDEFYIHF